MERNEKGQFIKGNRGGISTALVNGKIMHSRIFYSWGSMKNRCSDNRNGSYAQYGARGIKVCDRWLDGEGGKSGFKCFYEDMGERPEGMTLDRINSNENYTPENCRWATLVEQIHNRSNTVWLSYRGITHTAKEWSYLCNCPYRRLMKRLEQGWTMEKILFTPLKKGNFNGNI